MQQCTTALYFERSILHSTVTMTKHSKKHPSSKSGNIVQTNIPHFCLSIGHSFAAIEHNQVVVVVKENRGDERSKQFTLKYTATTTTLLPPKHWCLDLEQQIICFRGARMAGRAMMVTLIDLHSRLPLYTPGQSGLPQALSWSNIFQEYPHD